MVIHAEKGYLYAILSYFSVHLFCKEKSLKTILKILNYRRYRWERYTVMCE